MNDDDRRVRAVPIRRLSRLSQFGRLAGGVAGGMLAEGARRLTSGQRPALRDMLLTPGNAGRVVDRLSHLRGAAMKLGQMISLDSGDVLPAELTELFALLRDRAHRMPPMQLQGVLTAAWGKEWRRRFKHFDATPIAAASIGQVHRATTVDGRYFAIKVQYPGVRESIDADGDNVATLLRMSGMLPRALDMTGLLGEAKRQLHEETDYLREGAQMEAFRHLLDGREGYVVPALAGEFTTPDTLAMTYIAGRPIESLIDAPQEERDRVMSLLIDLVFDELFVFGLMKTDPNFANYRYQPETGRIVLLDFGATRRVMPATGQAYFVMVAAGLSGDRDAVRPAAVQGGFIGHAAADRHRALFDDMIDEILATANRGGPFDFADRRLQAGLKDQALAIASDRTTWHLPPADTLFVQRKISGTALLAARLRARVDVRGKAAAILGMPTP